MVNGYLKSQSGNNSVTTNFQVREFACMDGSDPIFISPELGKVLQAIRTHFGRPVSITSAYRTATHNKRVGGSPKSQHLLGMAADIKVVGVSPRTVAAYAETLLQNRGGIGIYSTFTHVDVREVKNRWNG